MSSDSCNRQGFQFCVCKDPALVEAQALSILALFASWGGWLNVLTSISSFVVLHAVVWCCKMNRFCLVAAGVVAAIAGAVSCCKVGCALYLENGSNIGIMPLVGGALWVACAGCVFTFARNRLPNLEHDREGEKQQQQQQQPQIEASSETAGTTATVDSMKVPLVLAAIPAKSVGYSGYDDAEEARAKKDVVVTSLD